MENRFHGHVTNVEYFYSTWDSDSETLSVNERLYFERPNCLTSVSDGDMLNVIVVDKETDKVVWEGSVTVYD